MEGVKLHPTRNEQALVKQLQWYYRWGRLVFWMFSIAACLVLVMLYIQMFTPLLKVHVVPSAEVCMELYPDVCPVNNWIDKPITAPLSSTSRKSNHAGSVRSLNVQHAPSRELTNPVARSPHIAQREAGLNEYDRRDPVQRNRRIAIALLPSSFVGFGLGIWGLVDNCMDWKTDKETGQKKEGAENGSQCVINSIVTMMSIAGAISSGSVFYANIKQSITVYVGEPGSRKRNDRPWGSPTGNLTGIQELSDALGFPVSYLGEHHYHWPLGDTESDEPTHHSSIISFEHPKSAIHLAPMGNSSDGQFIWKVGLGSGKARDDQQTTPPRRRGADRYNHFENQAFTGGAGIYMKAVNNPDGSPLDNPSQFNFNDMWDSMFQQIYCYLEFSGMDNPTALEFQAYDNAARSTAWAGVLAFSSGTGSTSISQADLPSGLNPNPYCINYEM